MKKDELAFFYALGDIGDDLVTEAYPSSRTERFPVRRLLQAVLAAAACFAAVLAVLTNKGLVLFPKEQTQTSETHESTGSDTGPVCTDVVYTAVSGDWPAYGSAEELAGAADMVLLGKVTNISFQVLDDQTGGTPSAQTHGWNRSLYTICTVDVVAVYKGNPPKSISIRIVGGQKGAFVDEQLSALGEDAKDGIPIVECTSGIKIGQTYLFLLRQYDDAMPTPVSPEQGVYPLDDPLAKDPCSLVSPKEIISCFGEDKWDEFLEMGLADSK